jgi:hypothetical protein
MEQLDARILDMELSFGRQFIEEAGVPERLIPMFRHEHLMQERARLWNI